jgi:secondary thiamine-phosphate synthase enzyme
MRHANICAREQPAALVRKRFRIMPRLRDLLDTIEACTAGAAGGRSGTMTATHTLEVHTKGQGDVHDLTGAVGRAVSSAGLRSGIITVFVTGSTAGITTIEYEPGAISDLGRAYERIAPRQGEYAHHLRWGDDNGSSHVRAAMLGPSVTIPFVDGRPALGTWQQIVLVEFDTGPRGRHVVIQVMGERE